MDDHEVDNNWAGYIPQEPWAQTELEFKVRRLAAFKAFYEHMPMEQPPVLKGLESLLPMYGAYRFGPAQVHLLDTRQFRSDQVCGDSFPGEKACDALSDPRRTMLGGTQSRWLLKQSERSQAPINVLAQQTWFAPYRYSDRPEHGQYNMDQWDGYPVERQRILNKLTEVSHPVVLNGDWHCANAATLHQDPHNPSSAKMATSSQPHRSTPTAVGQTTCTAQKASIRTRSTRMGTNAGTYAAPQRKTTGRLNIALLPTPVGRTPTSLPCKRSTPVTHSDRPAPLGRRPHSCTL